MVSHDQPGVPRSALAGDSRPPAAGNGHDRHVRERRERERQQRERRDDQRHDHGSQGHAAEGHDHGRGHHSAVSRSLQRRALWFALVANAAFLGVEVAGGLLFRSLALLADASHMLSDVVGLGVALVAQRLVERPATARHSYGWQRAEVLGAQVNGLTLLVVSGWIVFEAVQRLGEPADVAGGGLLVVASLGLAVNVVSAVALARVAGESLNMRGALLHMLTDAAGSAAAIVAGVAVLVWDARWVDPVVSIAIAALVLWSTWGLLRDTARILLEGTPRGMDPARVQAALAADDEVEAVHHLHLWNLASDVPALSAHVVLRGERTLHDAQATGVRLKSLLWVDHGIAHATLELECHPCEADDEPADQRADRPADQRAGEVADVRGGAPAPAAGHAVERGSRDEIP